MMITNDHPLQNRRNRSRMIQFLIIRRVHLLQVIANKIFFLCNIKFYICISDKKWLDRQYHDGETKLIKKPNELEKEMEDPETKIDEALLNRIQGSIIGMALGDALGAHVEFRPYEYVKENPVKDLEGGGTWGLEKGQVFFL